MTGRSKAIAPRRRPSARPAAARSPMRQTDRRTSRRDRERVWVLVEGLPSKMPVLPAEIEVIETYFGAFLDELLAGHTGGRPGLPIAGSSGTLPRKEEPE